MLRQTYRIYPNKKQEKHLLGSMDNCRYVWNYFLALNKSVYETNKVFCWYKGTKDKTRPYAEGMSKFLTQLKKDNPWLNEGDALSLQNTLINLDTALKRCVKKISRFPKFKSKHQNNVSLEINQVNRHIVVEPKQIKIPKLGWVKAKVHRPMAGNLKSIIIKKEGTHWIVSALYDTDRVKPEINLDTAIGIDLGLKTLAVFSNGTEIQSPKFLKKSEDKMAKAQRALSKTQPKSKNRSKKRKRVTKIYQQIRNQRKDFLHKVTTAIAKQYSVVFLETLGIQEMSKTKSLAKLIADQGLRTFIEMLRYKINVHQIDRWTPSTKMCNECGHTRDMKLSDRTYVCDNCGMILDRDHNAAINILQFGLAELREGLGQPGWPEVKNVLNKQEIDHPTECSGSRVPLGAR